MDSRESCGFPLNVWIEFKKGWNLKLATQFFTQGQNYFRYLSICCLSMLFK